MRAATKRKPTHIVDESVDNDNTSKGGTVVVKWNKVRGFVSYNGRTHAQHRDTYVVSLTGFSTPLLFLLFCAFPP